MSIFVARSKFAEWLGNQPRGTLAAIHRREMISYTSLYRAIQGLPIRWETAVRLSVITGIGPTDLVEPWHV